MRKICIFTSTRADYGLLRGVIKQISDNPQVRLQMLASGSHLCEEFGFTLAEIREDGFEPDETVDMLLASDSPVGICKSMGLAMIGYGESLKRLDPDLTVALGDRFETFCFAAAAQTLRIPVAHIHGGETTEGAIDEAFRHAITKLSYLHFTACEDYRWRVIQLGETPERVFNVGALGVENAKKVTLMTAHELRQSICFDWENPFYVVTFHPTTLESGESAAQFDELLMALQKFPTHKILFTKSNADAEGRAINRLIDKSVGENPKRWTAVSSLGMRRYLSALRRAEAVIGNSSSGIIEAPSFGIPTINIGDRQKGRIRADSVIDCNDSRDDIINAIKKAMTSEFKKICSSCSNPYEKEDTAKSIASKISTCSISKKELKKRFYDLPIKKW